MSEGGSEGGETYLESREHLALFFAVLWKGLGDGARRAEWVTDDCVVEVLCERGPRVSALLGGERRKDTRMEMNIVCPLDLAYSCIMWNCQA